MRSVTPTLEWCCCRNPIKGVTLTSRHSPPGFIDVSCKWVVFLSATAQYIRGFSRQKTTTMMNETKEFLVHHLQTSVVPHLATLISGYPFNTLDFKDTNSCNPFLLLIFNGFKIAYRFRVSGYLTCFFKLGGNA